MPTERPPLVGEVSAKFADRECHVVSLADTYGLNSASFQTKHLIWKRMIY
jgi:hypothetical protein